MKYGCGIEILLVNSAPISRVFTQKFCWKIFFRWRVMADRVHGTPQSDPWWILCIIGSLLYTLLPPHHLLENYFFFVRSSVCGTATDSFLAERFSKLYVCLCSLSRRTPRPHTRAKLLSSRQNSAFVALSLKLQIISSRGTNTAPLPIGLCVLKGDSKSKHASRKTCKGVFVCSCFSNVQPGGLIRHVSLSFKRAGGTALNSPKKVFFNGYVLCVFVLCIWHTSLLYSQIFWVGGNFGGEVQTRAGLEPAGST